MSRERLVPTSAGTIFKDTGHHAFLQFGVISQEERSRRISQVDSIDTTVTIVLFREEEQVTIRILEQLMGGNHLTVSQCTQFRVFFATCFFCIVQNHFVVSTATFHDRRIVCFGTLKGIEDAYLTIMLPVGHTRLIEVFDSINIIVTQHQEAGFAIGTYFTQIVSIGHSRHLVGTTGHALGLCRQQRTLGSKLVLHTIIVTQADSCIGTYISCQISISPINTDTVSFSCEDRLVDSPCLYIIDTVTADHFRTGRLRQFIDGKLRSGLHIHLHIMLLFVQRTNAIRNIINGSRQQIEVVHHQRCGKHQVQFHRTASKRVVSLCGEYAYRFLDGCRLKTCRLFVQAIKAEIYISTSCCVVTVCGKYVFSFLQLLLGCIR